MLRIPCLVLAFLLIAPAAHAQLEEQAVRQIELARQDLAEGHYERAVNSASSALRLDPMLYDALVIKGLAYEKLNEPLLAYSLLVTYQELTRGMVQNPDAASALARLRKLIAGVIDAPLQDGETAGSSPAAETVRAAVSLPSMASSETDGPSVLFEILSARNQIDLYRQMNDVLKPGPVRVRFRSQSEGKGDDFYFGLGEARWDDENLDLGDRSFTVVVDSDKLVSKAQSGSTFKFDQSGVEHEVQLWFDGARIAMRIDGEALGPLPARSIPNAASWFLELNDRARVWNLEALGWDGDLASGVIPSGFEGASSETTEVDFTEHPIPQKIDEETDSSDLAELLPDVSEAAALRVRFAVQCTKKTAVIVRAGDGREVTVAKAVDVRGAMRVPKFDGGLVCRGNAEQIELLFAADGAVSGAVDGREFGPIYPGRTGDGKPLFRVKADVEDGWVEGLVYGVGARRGGRRVFRAGSG